MYRVTVVYDDPADKEAFDRRYTDEHVPLVKAVPGLGSFQLSHPQGGTPYLVAELFWPSEDAYQAGRDPRDGRDPQARGGLRHDVHGLHRRRRRSLIDCTESAFANKTGPGLPPPGPDRSRLRYDDRPDLPPVNRAGASYI